MCRLRFPFALSFILVVASLKAQDLPKNFIDLLSRDDMTFEALKGLVPVPIVYNRSMSYEYALKYPDKNFEIRYAIRPADNLWKEYEQTKKTWKKGDINTNPDSTYISAFETVILNCSNGEFPKIVDFEKASVKAEFNADWGGTVAFRPRKDFAQDYKYCMIVAIHRSKIGDAYIFYLSDTQDGFNDLVAPAFHSLLFNKW